MTLTVKHFQIAHYLTNTSQSDLQNNKFTQQNPVVGASQICFYVLLYVQYVLYSIFVCFYESQQLLELVNDLLD